ncbi:MAG: TIM-barrel domain-containing protein, partial [Spirochaetota bacterium]
EAGKLDEVTFFMRAGFTGSQRYSPMMWAGDQNVDWSEDDGLPSVIPAALSLAVCGHGVHHSDIGGYTTLFGMKRDRELFMRWAELSVFSSMMRSHEGNRPGDNWQFDSDEATLYHLASMSRLFVELKPYRKDMLARNSREGLPLQRPLFMSFEGDEAAWTIKDEFMFGDDILVAPVIVQGALSRKVHLPPARWIHAWSGLEYEGGDHEIAAPIGQPPAFVLSASGRLGDLLKAFASAKQG